MNTGHTLTTDEWITKLEKKQTLWAELRDWAKVRSVQLKIDNALGIVGRGKIGHIIAKYTELDEKLPNRKARREEIRNRPKTAEGQISMTNQSSQRHASNPTAAINEKDVNTIRAAKGRLYESVKNSIDGHLVWGSTVDSDDNIVIFSTSVIKDLPSKFEGYDVVAKIGAKPDESIRR